MGVLSFDEVIMGIFSGYLMGINGHHGESSSVNSKSQWDLSGLPSGNSTVCYGNRGPFRDYLPIEDLKIVFP